MTHNPNTGLATRKTAAQRQAARRLKLRVQENQRRLNVWIEAGACNALRRMAQRDAVTQSQCLERLLRQAEDRIIATLELDSPGWEAYFRLDHTASGSPDNPRPKESLTR
jgi:hypothetical protein